jgi:hypothetical protein
MTAIAELTSNQFYGGLNRRFTNRSAILRSCGFKYVQVCKNLAAFTRGDPDFNDYKVIPAAEVAHADSRSWRDLLATTLRRGYVLDPICP